MTPNEARDALGFHLNYISRQSVVLESNDGTWCRPATSEERRMLELIDDLTTRDS